MNDSIDFKQPSEKTETTAKLVALHHWLSERGRELMVRKNSDYANPASSADPFRNFRGFGAFGILVRLSDKLARLRGFIEKASKREQLAIKNESWEDTIIDGINYLVLLDGYIRTHGVD